MELSVVMVCMADRPWSDAVRFASELGFTSVEACGGGYFPRTHYDPRLLVEDDDAVADFVSPLKAAGLSLAALACCANPLHPNSAEASEAHEDFLATCELAAKIGAPRISVLSGCPGGSPGDRSVNWIVPSVFDNPVQDVQEDYRWQWEEVVIPYWRDACDYADRYGVALCLEPIASNVVYNPETFARLQEAVGGRLRALVDPSHLFWQGIDVVEWIEALGHSVGYAHLKDVSFDRRILSRVGVASAAAYDDWQTRPWIPRALGYGHGSVFWREFLVALRRAGYDGPVSIEVEEPFLTIEDSLRQSVDFIRPLLPTEPLPSGNWFNLYSGE